MALDDIMKEIRAFDGDKARRAAVSLMFTPAGQKLAQKAQGAANYTLPSGGNFSKLTGGISSGAGGGGVPGADIAQSLYALKDDAIDAVNVSSRSLWNNTGQGLFTKGMETAGGETSAFLDNRTGRTPAPQFGKRPYGGPEEEDDVDEDDGTAPVNWGPLRPTDTEDVGGIGQIPGIRPVGPHKPPKKVPATPKRGHGGLLIPGEDEEESTTPRPYPYPL